MLNVVVTGISIGAVYAITALCYNVMFSTSKVLSVTTGHLVMIGGVVGAWALAELHVPAPLALALAIAGGGLFGLITELFAIRRVLARSDEHLWLLSTLALATILQQVVALWWGTEPRPFPKLLPESIGSGVVDQKHWLPVVAAVALTIAMELFFRRTLYGKLFVAVSEDPFAARARGIDTDRLRTMSYVMAGAMGALAGFAAGQLTFAFFALGLSLTLNGFIALALGGLGSNAGAIVGGLALGLLSTFATHFIGGEYQQTVSVGLLVIVLLARPQGLFGTLTTRAV